jgi:hypothetical protein
MMLYDSGMVLWCWEMWLLRKEFVVLSHGTTWATVVRVIFLPNYHHGKAVAYPMAVFSGKPNLRFHKMLWSVLLLYEVALSTFPPFKMHNHTQRH